MAGLSGGTFAGVPAAKQPGGQGATCIGKECYRIIECEGHILSIRLEPCEAAEASGMLNMSAK